MKKPLAELNKCLYILEARQIVTHMYRKPNRIIHIPCVQYLSNLKFLSKIWTQGSENKYRYSGTNQGMSPVIFLSFYEFSSFVN